MTINRWEAVNTWTGVITVTLGQATETDSSLTAQPDRAYALAQVPETDTAQALTVNQAAMVLDSAPSELIRGTTLNEFVVSSVAAVPTLGNTTITSGSVSLTVTSITGSGPYTIQATCPASLALQHDATGYAWTVTIGAETVVTSDIPLNPPAGYQYIDLVSPITTSGSLLQGFTGDTPVTGDQLVAWTDTDPGNVAITLNADGTFELVTRPPNDQTISRYVIQANGTLGTEAVYTVEFTVSAAVGQASQTDSVFAFGKSKSAAIGQSIELDFALTVDANVQQIISLGQAEEANAALSIDTVGFPRIIALEQASEFQTAFGFDASAAKGVGQASETSEAQEFGARRSRELLQAFEADESLAFSVDGPAPGITNIESRDAVFSQLLSREAAFSSQVNVTAYF